ncbi:hypothetical protein Aph01nite_72240 [Acrocarpospora phusangensis]|uniref:DUF4245 domain-containing protein n=1 Tax=Acrocarpospora phusangensis TaxID=1070424 RepID=A0A919QIZ6_9ACTN|nr:DUF4245 domain-containing protein [Acrocarpospora phusangensis]GIH28914.1 hypothetical protein Aph01nite_72240 [Acrocarpospora phusangensis]
MRQFTQGFYGYAFALFVCLLAVGAFLLITPQSRTEHIPRVDFTIDTANAARLAKFEVEVPRAVPAGWTPTSSRVTQDKGTVTWRLGFATGKRMHAMLAQSDEAPTAAFANRMANTETVTGTQQIAGNTWEQRVREDKNQRSLVRVLPDRTIIITGSADWSELTALATALTPAPEPVTSS